MYFPKQKYMSLVRKAAEFYILENLFNIQLHRQEQTAVSVTTFALL